MDNTKKIEQIRQDNAEVLEKLNAENTNIEKLIQTYQATNKIIENAVQSNDVNEEYIFEMLDKWASLRKLKIKK